MNLGNLKIWKKWIAKNKKDKELLSILKERPRLKSTEAIWKKWITENRRDEGILSILKRRPNLSDDEEAF